MLINMVTEYLYCTFYVFKNSMNTNNLGKKEKEALAQAGKKDETIGEVEQEKEETAE